MLKHVHISSANGERDRHVAQGYWEDDVETLPCAQ